MLEGVVISPAIKQDVVRSDEVSIRTVRTVGDGGNLYNIQTEDEGEEAYITVPKYPPHMEKLVSNLKRGDKIIVVRSGEQTKLVYGPIEDSLLYVR